MGEAVERRFLWYVRPAMQQWFAPEPEKSLRTQVFGDGSGCHTSLYWLILPPGLMWT